METERAGGGKRGMASQMGSDKTEGERETGPQSGPGLEVWSERRLTACSFSSPDLIYIKSCLLVIPPPPPPSDKCGE